MQPSPGGLEKSLRRARQREQNRRLGAGVLSLLLTTTLAIGVWSAFGRQQPKPVERSSPTPNVDAAQPHLFLAGNGEMWIVDVSSGSVRHFEVPELTPGDPPDSIVARGDKLVLWGYTTFVMDKTGKLPPRVLVKDSLLFVPSAHEARVWVVFGSDTGNVHTVREVSLDGRVTFGDVQPPRGRSPLAAVKSGLVLEGPRRSLEVWNPSTGEVFRRLPGQFPVASHGNWLAWCANACATLRVTNVATGEDRKIDPPAGTYGFQEWGGAFSPDGKLIAVPVRRERKAITSRRELAIVDVAKGTSRSVAGTNVDRDYPRVAWAPSGETVFMSNRNARRTIIRYDVKTDAVRRLPISVSEFAGMAAA